MFLRNGGQQRIQRVQPPFGTRPLAQNSGAWEYLLPDALGSVRQIVDANGNVTLAESYEPYGSVLTSTGTASSIFAYAGEQIDTTGLIYLRARYLNPRLGIFLARDPWSGDVLRPGSVNGFNYVEGNPVNRIDPSGWQGVRPADCMPPYHLESVVVWSASLQRNVTVIQCVDSNGLLYIPPEKIKSGIVFVGADPSTLAKAILVALGITCLGITTLEAARSTDVDWPKPPGQPKPTTTPFPPPQPDLTPSAKYALDTNALIALEHWVWSTDDRDGGRLAAKIKNAHVYYSPVAREEFLNGGPFAQDALSHLDELIARYDMIPIWNTAQIIFDEVTKKYVSAGRTLTPHTLNDIQIIAGAMSVNATLLTREGSILNLFPSPISESW